MKGRGTARHHAVKTSLPQSLNTQVLKKFEVSVSNSFVVDIIAGGGGFLKPLLKVGVIPHTPFEVRDGWVEWTISCAREKVRDLLSGFDNEEIPYQLVSTRGITSRLLTPRQRYVFDTAMKEGFYDVPRRITLTELASVLDVAKSTLSAQLHRIESTVTMPMLMTSAGAAPNMFVRTCSQRNKVPGVLSTKHGQPTEDMGRLDSKL